ncbi:hypothetical protein GCM10012288_07630 [Malaciobacter pacificus]|uniref:Two-component system response regulator n=1 Tax=Malaciobacter pacificus TaxID=1080223 RepID=A0A5C2H4X8_9BACT|nr:response regulator [Malaciobacter pacificus]QEP34050.1 two-component system response regulator [Malaciobacter pacificus]GGD36126.1 hypothetical protein GCM10012288_07630 [Malaciobacter pacificus]
MEKINILIIEDDKIIALHISKILKRIGIKNIHKTSNANDAFDLIKTNGINLVLSDIKIEGALDGINIVESLQNLYDIPVIFISAYKDAETLRRVSQTNFLGYLLKPFRKEELEVLINLAINKYNLSTTNNIIVINDYYSFDKNKNILFFNEQKVPLSQKEILALTLLSNNLNSYVSYELFESTVWFNSNVNDNTRRIFIHRLKNKLQKLEIKIEKNVGVGIFN